MPRQVKFGRPLGQYVAANRRKRKRSPAVPPEIAQLVADLRTIRGRPATPSAAPSMTSAQIREGLINRQAGYAPEGVEALVRGGMATPAQRKAEVAASLPPIGGRPALRPWQPSLPGGPELEGQSAEARALMEEEAAETEAQREAAANLTLAARMPEAAGREHMGPIAEYARKMIGAREAAAGGDLTQAAGLYPGAHRPSPGEGPVALTEAGKREIAARAGAMERRKARQVTTPMAVRRRMLSAKAAGKPVSMEAAELMETIRGGGEPSVTQEATVFGAAGAAKLAQFKEPFVSAQREAERDKSFSEMISGIGESPGSGEIKRQLIRDYITRGGFGSQTAVKGGGLPAEAPGMYSQITRKMEDNPILLNRFEEAVAGNDLDEVEVVLRLAEVDPKIVERFLEAMKGPGYVPRGPAASIPTRRGPPVDLRRFLPQGRPVGGMTGAGRMGGI